MDPNHDYQLFPNPSSTPPHNSAFTLRPSSANSRQLDMSVRPVTSSTSLNYPQFRSSIEGMRSSEVDPNFYQGVARAPATPVLFSYPPWNLPQGIQVYDINPRSHFEGTTRPSSRTPFGRPILGRSDWTTPVMSEEDRHVRRQLRFSPPNTNRFHPELSPQGSADKQSSAVVPMSSFQPQPKTGAIPKFRPRSAKAVPNIGNARQCKFCLNNGEPINVYNSHILRNHKTGVLICPILRSHVCELCGATGDQAHTKNYCPVQSNHMKQALPISLKTTARQSDGQLR